MTDVRARIGADAEKNIALLIDADNASPDHLDEVLLVLGELGTINVRRAYGNWAKASLKNWGTLTGLHSIVPMQQFDVVKGKSATDMRMTIDAMDLLYRGHVHGFGIMSSDSDFMPLAVSIKQDGLPVYGFGTAKTPEAFREACTRFIDVGALAKADAAEVQTHTAPPAESGVDEAVVKLLGDAIKAAKRDERGYASLNEVGKLAGNRSSFDARNYGYSRLSELIEELPNFQAEKREGGAVFVKRVR